MKTKASILLCQTCGGAILALLAGCGSEEVVEFEQPDAFPFVQCKVEVDGKVVDNAIVTLHSRDNSGPSDQKIVGQFDSDNDCYRFLTIEGSQKKAGVPEGEYVVAVKPGPRTRVKPPAKYAAPETSGLTASIHGEENFLPTFVLTN